MSDWFLDDAEQDELMHEKHGWDRRGERMKVKTFLSAMNGNKEEQLAISQCLDLETTRAWLYCEIDARFYRLEKEESGEEEE